MLSYKWDLVRCIWWPRGCRRLFAFSAVVLSLSVFGGFRNWPLGLVVAMGALSFLWLMVTRPIVQWRRFLNQLRVDTAEAASDDLYALLHPHRPIPDTPNSPSTSPKQTPEHTGDGSPAP